ncbi:Ubiquinone/menaquinone biosynthesis C-methylase UbiE [Fontibacillus panacisegetis]|uniref:Ubiquinone/menaquinone biosynthesis C-methylase UbiE n=1 Tax=Fontibacillus panacisegetis TaxID=670482 RepID=A0A1G7HAQ4_9BACL|nr:class I SAM-dependent methyltransferase [Fontibacillus panacisegetis]SDE97498.1 Ubiquinone/menaquinone biosynthesis C-methylase UbiE [Fontibacillus panacisegetis]
MLPQGNSKNNIERFSGFADVYDQYRPEAPEFVVNILTGYLERKPNLVMDVGCGTGLSTLIWKDHAEQVIGVEPNDDMRSKAEDKLRMAANADHITFVSGYSNQLNTSDDSVDIITCSQSFHWMEPISTLNEAYRVLQRGGIFAVYDCDWPPVVNWRLEQEYLQLIDHADALVAQCTDKEIQAVKRNKNEHLQVIQESEKFRYTREIVFHHSEACDAERFVGLALSQGGIQTVFKLGIEGLDLAIESFRSSVTEHFKGNSMDIVFSYRLRLGIK